MPQFPVDDDLAALVWRLAKPKPFENLSFSAALRRVLQGRAVEQEKGRTPELEDLLKEAKLGIKKLPSPSVLDWVASVPELKSKKGMNTWQAVCDALKIDTGGDSARRRLKNWVKANRPSWPSVPSIH
jgi:hypothetical protein